MSGINTGRVLLGGLLAGLVFNIGESILNAGLLADTMQEMTQRHNLNELTGAHIGVFVLLGFLFGILMVWVYAAVRPRLGAGPKTAAIVGAVLWFPAYAIPVVGWSFMGMISAGLATLLAAWGLVEIVLSTIAGAWLYKEKATEPVQESMPAL